MTRPFRLGLTGSIGMGKTTTAALFADEGLPVWDADAEVHRLYQAGGRGAEAIAAIVPEAIVGGQVDRVILRDAVMRDAALLSRIEAAVHPLVAESRQAFLAKATRQGHAIVVMEIPLLFETGADNEMDGTAVVSAPAAVQRERVLARPGMSDEALARILSRQIPDAEKRRRATWVINTETRATAQAGVKMIIAEILSGGATHA